MNTKVGIALAMLIICGSAFAADASKSPNTNHTQKSAPPPTTIFNRKLQSTTIVQGESDVEITAATFTSIDSPLKFTCPTGGCTVSVEVNAQMGGTTDTSNFFAVCGLLDGNFMPPPGGGNGCPYVGETQVDGGYSVGTFVFTQSGVHAGSHTLQSQVFINQGALLGNYSITYRLYTP
jgi:hypothetical protein